MSKYAFQKHESDLVISEENAIASVTELLQYYDIDVDRVNDESALKAIERALDQITLHVRRGVLEFSRDEKSRMNVMHKLSNGDVLIYTEIGSKAKLAMEKFDPNAGYSRIYAFMGSLSGVGKAGIEKLPAKDLAVVELLGTVFMNA